ncbi:hypothetical protein E4U46_000324 [Claviceps purpurea]|nr:hypothetical protein E4U46_000324 [Claviceps purpurea]
MESHTASQQQIVTVTDRARQFVESIIDCRSSSAVQDGGQTTLLTSRVDAIEDTVQDLERQMGSANTKMDRFETMVVAIHGQLNAMKESNDKLTAQVTRLELSMNHQFTEMDDKFTNLESSMESSMDSRFKKMDAKFTKMNTQMKKMDQSINTQLQGMNSRITELSSDMHSGFEEMTEKNEKTSIKMEAL